MPQSIISFVSLAALDSSQRCALHGVGAASFERLVAGTIRRADSTTSPYDCTYAGPTPPKKYRARGDIVAPEINTDLIKSLIQSCDSEHSEYWALSRV